jgi:hypothetical protein
MRIELTKDYWWDGDPGAQGGYGYNTAGRLDMQNFSLFEITYSGSPAAAACSDELGAYVTGMINGEQGKLITAPILYGKMYALVETPSSSPPAIHIVMPQTTLNQLVSAGLAVANPPGVAPNGATFDSALRGASWRNRVTNLATNDFAQKVIAAVKDKMGYPADFTEIYITPYDAAYTNGATPVPTFADNPVGSGTRNWHIGRLILQKTYVDSLGNLQPMDGVTFSFSLVHINEDGSVHKLPNGDDDLTPIRKATTGPQMVNGALMHGIADPGPFFLHDFKIYPLGPAGQPNHYWFVRSGNDFYGQDAAPLNVLTHEFSAADRAGLFTTQAAAQARAASLGGGVAELAYTLPHSPLRSNTVCRDCTVRVRIHEILGHFGYLPLGDINDVQVICHSSSTDDGAVINHFYLDTPIINGDPSVHTYFRIAKYGYTPTTISAAAWAAIVARYTDEYDRFNAFGQWLNGTLTSATAPGLPDLSGAQPRAQLGGIPFLVYEKT